MDFRLLPDFLAISGLVGIFISLLRRTHETRMRYWAIGWVLVLTHIVAEFIALNIRSGSDAVYAASAVALLLASVGFIWAARTPHRERTRALVFMGLAEIPDVIFIFCLYGGVAANGVYLGLIAAGALATLLTLGDGMRSDDHRQRAFHAGGIVVAYAIQAILVIRGTSEYAFDWMLCWHYLAVAILFGYGAPRRTPGVTFTTLSFLAWAAVFPVAALLYRFAPSVHVESEVWNLPKFLVASGMILTLLEEQMAKAEQAALHDALTGLPNRRLYALRLQEAIERAASAHRRVALIAFDLDRFKQINDRFGHGAGDEALCTVAQRFSARLRASDTLARTGGDEFVAILCGVYDRAAVDRVVRSLADAMAEPVVIDHQPVTLGVSIGAALYPDDGIDPAELLKLADRRMYEGKRADGPVPA